MDYFLNFSYYDSALKKLSNEMQFSSRLFFQHFNNSDIKLLIHEYVISVWTAFSNKKPKIWAPYTFIKTFNLIQWLYIVKNMNKKCKMSEIILF